MTEQNKYSTTPRDYNHVGEMPQTIATGKALGKVDPTSQLLARDIRNFAWAEDTQESIARFIEWCAILYNFTTDRNDYIDFSVGQMNTMFNDVIKELSEDKDYHSLPEIAGARGGFDTLGERLNDTDTQLVQTHHEATRKRQLEDLDEKVLSAIEGGEGTTFNLLSIPQNRSVTQYKTTFAKKGKNIFDGNFEKGLAVLGGGVGVIAEAEGAYIDITEVQPNTLYTVSKSESNRFRIYASDKYPEVGDTVNNLYLGDSDNIANLTTSQDTKYLITYVSNGGLPPSRFQIALGRNNLEYESPDVVRIALASNTVDAKAINFPTNGWLSGQPRAFVVSFENNTITTSSQGGFVHDGSTQYPLIDGTYSFDDFSVNSLVVAFNKKNHQVEIHGSSQTFEGDHLILGVIRVNEKKADFEGLWDLKGLPEEPIEGNNKKTFIPDKPSGAYDFDPVDFNPNVNRNYDTLLSIYDGLVADFPEYVTRTKLADEESGLPLYLYRFTPIKTVNAHNNLKILIFVTHGHEVQATYGVAYFLNSLAREWQNDSRLNMIRHNVEILVVPQSNPYGFNLGQRPNYNGVDIARNYPAGWSFNDNPETGYGTHGSEPLSEIGNQVTNQVLLDNLDADFVIDNHNYGGDPASSTSMPLMWARASNAEAEKVVNGHIHQMVGKARLDGYVPMSKSLGGIVSKDRAPYGTLIDQVRNLGLDGTIMENMNTLNGSTDDSNIFKFNTENLGNLVINAVRYYG